jgi:hypothetical protein
MARNDAGMEAVKIVTNYYTIFHQTMEIAQIIAASARLNRPIKAILTIGLQAMLKGCSVSHSGRLTTMNEKPMDVT